MAVHVAKASAKTVMQCLTMMLVLLVTFEKIEGLDGLSLCKETKVCEKSEERCGVNSKNGFVPFTATTARDPKYGFIIFRGEPYGICTVPATTTTTMTTTITTTTTSTLPKVCMNSGMCSAGQTCGMYYDGVLVELTEKTKSRYDFLPFAGSKVALCINKATGISTGRTPLKTTSGKAADAITTAGSMPSHTVKVAVTVEGIDFNNKNTKKLFEQTFTKEAGALRGIYKYTDVRRRSLRKLAESTEIEATLGYKDKRAADSNSDKLGTGSFRDKLSSALKKQEPSAFVDTKISSVQVLKSSSTTSSTEDDESSDPDDKEIAFYITVAIVCIGVPALIVVVLMIRNRRNVESEPEDPSPVPEDRDDRSPPKTKTRSPNKSKHKSGHSPGRADAPETLPDPDTTLNLIEELQESPLVQDSKKPSWANDNNNALPIDEAPGAYTDQYKFDNEKGSIL